MLIELQLSYINILHKTDFSVDRATDKTGSNKVLSYITRFIQNRQNITVIYYTFEYQGNREITLKV